MKMTKAIRIRPVAAAGGGPSPGTERTPGVVFALVGLAPGTYDVRWHTPASAEISKRAG